MRPKQFRPNRVCYLPTRVRYRRALRPHLAIDEAWSLTQSEDLENYSSSMTMPLRGITTFGNASP